MFFSYEVRNSYFDERIPLENDKSSIYSDYKVPLVTAYWECRFEQWLKQTSLLVIGSCVVFQCYSVPILQKDKLPIVENKRTNSSYLMRQMSQAYVHMCDFLTCIFLICNCMRFMAHLIRIFWLTYHERYCRFTTMGRKKSILSFYIKESNLLLII